MLRWLSHVLSSRTAGRFARPLRIVRARYDAAATTGDNRRHWANADGHSANAANSPDIRRTLRNRARYEVANNSYARGIVLTLAHDVVGTGPRLQILTSDPEANHRIEREFQRWSKAVGLAEKLRTMRSARAQDGEAFAILTSNPALPGAVSLDLRLVEADQIATPDLNLLRTDAVDGIEFDEAGNPAFYHLLKHHPGDTQVVLGSASDYDRLPAESVIHWFRCDRPGQARGIPDIMPALPLFAQLRRFTLAVLAAAETAADFAGILYTDAPANGESDPAEPFEPIELEKRALLTMPGGWKMSQLEAEQPATTYAEFKREILNEIARCLNMPANVARADSSGYDIEASLLNQAGIKSGRYDVILSGDRGYRFADCLTVQFVDEPMITDITDITDTEEDSVVPIDHDLDVSNVRDDTASGRRAWILQRLAEGVQLKTPMVVERFRCSGKTAQRDLSALKEEGRIEFVGATRTGYYRLCQDPSTDS